MDRKDESIDMQLARIEAKLDKLIPEVRDVSKCIVSMRESMSKAQPSNHGRIGKMPRKQPKKKESNPHYCHWCKHLSFDKKGDWDCATGHGMIVDGDTIDFKTQNCPRWEDKAVGKS